MRVVCATCGASFASRPSEGGCRCPGKRRRSGRWYITLLQGTAGPLTRAEIRELLASGDLAPGARVWPETTET